MAVLAYDAFAGTNGTALTSHTSPQGYGWSMHPAIGNIATNGPAPNLDGSGAVTGQAGGSNVATFSFAAPADGEVQAVWTPSGSVGSYQDGLWVRLSASQDTGYLLWVIQDTATTYHLEAHARSAGSDLALGGTTAGAISAPSGTAVYLKLTASGTTISAAWAYASDVATTGWRSTSWTDATVGTAGYAGVQLRSGDNAALSNWRVQDPGTAYNAALPASATASSTDAVATATGTTVTVTGTNTAWTAGTTFSASAGSISGQSVNASTQVATLTYSNPPTAQTVSFTNTTDATSAMLSILAAATTYTFSVPARGFVSTAVTVSYALSGAGAVNGTATLTFSDGGAGGSFTGTATLSTSVRSGSITYTPPAGAATITISVTNNAANPALANPASQTLITTPGTYVLLGALNLTATFDCVDVELQYTGDSNANATLTVQYRQTGQSTWLNTEPVKARITAPDDGGALAWYHSAMKLQSGTSYDVLCTVADTDGINGPATVQGSVSTRAELPAVSSIAAPSYWIDPVGGNDSNSGLSAALAWKTLAHAIAQVNAGNASGTIGLLPGYYPADQTPITRASTWLAVTSAGLQNLACSLSNTTYSTVPFAEPVPNAANAGSRAVIYGGLYADPTGGTDAGAAAHGPWVSVNLTGPATGGTFTVWKWATASGQTIANPGILGYGASKAVEPTRVPSWNQSTQVTSGFTLNTAAGWAEMCQTNQTYQAGWFVDPADSKTLYLYWPTLSNPNTVWWWVGSLNNNASGTNAGLTVNGPNVVIVGPELRACQYGIWYQAGAVTSYDDYVYSALCQYHRYGTGTENNYPAASAYGADIVTQHFYCHDTNLRSSTWGNVSNPSGVSQTVAPWNFCKDWVVLQAASPGLSQTYFTEPGALNQSIAVAMSGGPQRWVTRYGTIDGLHDTWALIDTPTGTYTNGEAFYDRYQSWGSTFCYNVVRNIQDDGPETVANGINVKAYSNRIEKTLTGISVGRLTYGPFWVFDNQFWRTGQDGHAADAGAAAAGQSPLPGGTFCKWGDTGNVHPLVHYLGNTAWSDSGVVYGGTTFGCGGWDSDAGNAHYDGFRLRNSIVRGSIGYVAITPHNTTDSPSSSDYWDEDYNQLANADSTHGIRYGYDTGGPDTIYTTIAAYRTGTGQGAHSNPAGDIYAVAAVDAALASPTTGDLSLTAGSVFRAAGVVLPNLRDVQITSGVLPPNGYGGAAPDLGAVQYPPAVATPVRVTKTLRLGGGIARY